MFAVVRTGGKQYRVHPGDKIVVEKLDGNAGDKVTLGEVLLAGDGGSLKDTKGLTVAAEIVAQAKGEKVTAFKKRRRHNYRRKKGHRQQHTILRITAVGDQKAEKKPAPSKAEAAAPKAEKASAKSEAAATAAAGESVEAKAPKAEKKPAPSKAEGAAPAKAEKPAAKPSTKNAAPAKGGAKKAPKGK
ncbi:MAG TPA: 50S ribosomal protein L21 [Sphingomicrobium sp.]|nr:50S ribosomal protein L21 [Sphingomicrobium sp.]